MKFGGENVGKLDSSNSFAESSDSEPEDASGRVEESRATGNRCRRDVIAVIEFGRLGWIARGFAVCESQTGSGEVGEDAEERRGSKEVVGRQERRNRKTKKQRCSNRHRCTKLPALWATRDDCYDPAPSL